MHNEENITKLNLFEINRLNHKFFFVSKRTLSSSQKDAIIVCAHEVEKM